MRLEPLSESDQVAGVVLRLRARFPDLDESDVRAAVAGALDALATARLRHFVPLFVERLALTTCRERSTAGAVGGQVPVLRPAGSRDGGSDPNLASA